ncbi:uncharacterized protein LOC121246766 [Juglans microcarpa x Juglans regia]|uniref:uncharacterized protein LOC121246766 n=1 Tax=Juglans microcarpa x Juglans regia TaxID=2249226 RepID=UPI001B7E526B|nr:uncharacterized protein LOC121246766 [Juglans microcarpa x Juglans regia]
MCVDFTDINKACSKDSFPLPHIDLIVDSTADHRMLSFMNAYSGYNQISMKPEDEEKTSFIIDRDLYCYNAMPFGLKNAGATYQWTLQQHLDDLREAFAILRQYQMKLNPAKCAFGIGSRNFLEFIVSKLGIEVNPEKVDTVLVLRKAKTWDDECNQAFEAFKKYLASPLLLGQLQSGETLTLYLVESLQAASSILVCEEKRIQKSVYYISRAYRGVKARYPSIEQNHSGGLVLAGKATSEGYYWPQALQDAKGYARKCQKCQEYTQIPHCPPEKLTSITSPWSFAQWGLDLVGPLSLGKGVKFLMVVVDYFTKWVEAEGLATITASNIARFLWRSMVYRFGAPHTIISDNERQFDFDHYRNWCRELGIEFRYFSPGTLSSTDKLKRPTRR